MEMFVVNRYLGSTSNDLTDKEEEKLSNLLSKVEKRKNQKMISSAEVGCAVSAPDLESNEELQTLKNKFQASSKVARKKKRKKKLLCESLDTDPPKGMACIEKTDADIPVIEKEARDRTNSVDKPSASEFMVLGSDNFLKRQKVKRVLPAWLGNPSVVSVNLKVLSTPVDAVGLCETLVLKLKENNITHLFPVQTQVIPWLLASACKPSMYWPSDICVSAPTGSGKTLAFVLPIIQILSKRVVPHIRAVVILPVQDLAVQVYRVFKTYCLGTNLKVALITGWSSFMKEQQQLIKTSLVFGHQSLVDIVVTTPGRLVDHLKSTPNFSLKHLRFLVIDEADRVMECIQNDWLYHMNKNIYGVQTQHLPLPLTATTLRRTPAPPQKLLFSATLSQDPEKLQLLGLFQPKLFTSMVTKESVPEENLTDEKRGDFIGKYTTPAELEEKFCVVKPESKPLVLYFLITSGGWKNVLCFAKSQQSAHRLSLLLKHLSKEELSCAEVSSLLHRQQRDEILKKFSTGKINVLVSTDALARGMDIPDVRYVVSYDCPKFIKNYIHRIGRTGRAGKSGVAFTLLLQTQVSSFEDMLKTAGKSNIEQVLVNEDFLLPLEDEYKAALNRLKEDLSMKQSNFLQNIKQKKNRKVRYASLKTSLKSKKLKPKIKKK